LSRARSPDRAVLSKSGLIRGLWKERPRRSDRTRAPGGISGGSIGVQLRGGRRRTRCRNGQTRCGFRSINP